MGNFLQGSRLSRLSRLTTRTAVHDLYAHNLVAVLH
jgi:hypothetical protein